jgi:integrase
MKFCNLTDANNLLILAKDPLEIQKKIIDYVMAMRNREMSSVAINMYLAAIMHFYSMNDITLNRKKIGRYIPEKVRKQKDRPYTRAEIARMLQFCDIRSRAMVLLFASTGMRTGAVPGLTIGHLQKIGKYNLYQFTVYYGREEEYICFCTPECAKAIDDYLQYRQTCGELLTPESPLFRHEFDINDMEQIRKRAVPVREEAITKIITTAQHKSEVVVVEKRKEGEVQGKKRNIIMRTHGFRKYVETTFINLDFNVTKRETLLGHSLPGQDESYYRPTTDDLLQEYLKAVDALTVNEENRLRRENQTLKVNKSEIELLKEKAEKYEDFMATFNPQIEEFEREINSLKRHLNSKSNNK